MFHLLKDSSEVHGRLDDLVVTLSDRFRNRLLEPAELVHLRHRGPRGLQRLKKIKRKIRLSHAVHGQ